MPSLDRNRLKAVKREASAEPKLVNRPLSKVTRVSTDLDPSEYWALDDYCYTTKRRLGRASVTKVSVLRELIRLLEDDEDLQLAIARRLDKD